MSETEKIKQEMQQLQAELERHNRKYYVEHSPEITDYDYDQLFHRLKNLEKEHPDLAAPDSPTQKVGGEPLEGFVQVRHEVPMLSLDNSYSMEDMREFDTRVRKTLAASDQVHYVAEIKIDGVSISLLYRGGSLVRAATRGNGVVGDDITHNVRTIDSVPLRLAGDFGPDEEVEIRGEAFMSRPDFEKMNERREEAGEQLFKNPRNATAGSLKLLDPATTADRPLDVFLYWLRAPGRIMPETHSGCLELIREFGLRTEPNWRVLNSIDEVVEHINEWGEKRSTLEYENDGMVVKVDSKAQQRALGETGHHPRYAIAFKFPPEQKPTRVLDITMQVGRTGKLTPVAELEPILLSGTTVKRSTLHNEDEVLRLGIMVGDMAIVRKAGEIIPQVVEVLKDRRDGSEKPFEFPTHCPVCNTPAVRPQDEAITRCPNPFCPAQVLERLIHFASRGAMDIENMGPGLINQLVDAGLLTDFSDIYKLDAQTLSALDRMGEKSAANVMAGIEKSRSAPLDRFIFALGIRMVGARTGQILANKFGSIEKLMEATEEELAEITDIGPKVAASIKEFFGQEKVREEIARLREVGLTMEAEQTETSDTLAGKTFVITGALSRPRDEIKKEIETAGGKVTSAVSKKTDYLLCGEDPGSKRDKAERLGVAIIGETDLAGMVGEVVKQNHDQDKNLKVETETKAENSSQNTPGNDEMNFDFD